MNLDPTIFVNFLANFVPVETGVLDAYAVGLSSPGPIIPEEADELLTIDLECSNREADVAHELILGDGVYHALFNGGMQEPHQWDSDNKLVFLERIYAFCVQLVRVNIDIPEDYSGTGYTIDLSGMSANNLSPNYPPAFIDLPNLIGYIHGLNGFWAQAHPEGLWVNPGLSKFRMTPLGSNMDGTFRFLLLGKSTPVTVWTVAKSYAKGNLVTHQTPSTKFFCKQAHFSAIGGSSEPGMGGAWTTYWTAYKED